MYFMRLLSVIFILFIGFQVKAQPVYEVTSGTIDFSSVAPQEVIKASSPGLSGFINIEKKTFSFSIDMISFTGFNTPLQQNHFNENYMESAKYPKAVYSGKIIEEIDLLRDGVYNVRVKGKLKVHGLEQERIIRSHIIVKNRKITVNSDFKVALADHDIKVPRVVYDKLAPEIVVSVKAVLIPKAIVGR